MKKLLLFVLTFGTVILFGASKYYLTVADVEPQLATFQFSHEYGFADEGGFVEYTQIGVPDYDTFFKTAAKLDGLVILTNAMTQTTTAELKKYAISKAADETLAQSIKEIVGDTLPEQYTVEQSIAIMKLAKQSGKVKDDEVAYFTTTAISLGIGVYSLGKGVSEVINLLSQGSELLKNVKSSVKMMLVPAATKGLKGSIDNLQGVQKNAPRTLEEMKVLLEAFKALGNM